jgi:hypothetical protein
MPPSIEKLESFTLGNHTKAKSDWAKKCRELPPKDNGRRIKFREFGIPMHNGHGQLIKVCQPAA